MYPMYYDSYAHMAGWGIFGLLWMVVGWILMIWVIVYIVRHLAGGSRHRMERWQQMKGQSAIHILDERYAKGEINKEEYEQKKKDITSSHSPQP